MNSINVTEFAATVAGAMMVGFILKHAFPQFPNRMIPLVTLVLSTLGYLAMTDGWSQPQQWFAALIAAATATGTHSGLKNTFVNKSLMLFLCAGIAIAPFMTGCGTAPERITYQTASVTEITIDNAMTAWGHYVAQFHPPASEERAVKDAFEKYQAAALVVADAGKALAEGTGSQSALDVAIQNASASLGDLINLIQKFGVKITSTK